MTLGGAFGIHPIVATQRPGAENVQGLLKSNLSTRISLPVPDHATSKIILGRTGAEKLPKTQGRMLMVWDAKLTEVQAFRIKLPKYQTNNTSNDEALSLFTAGEVDLIQFAVQKLDGWFKIRELAEATGQSKGRVNDLAKHWESLGYLTVVQRNDQGHRQGRKITVKLLRTAGFAGIGEKEDKED